MIEEKHTIIIMLKNMQSKGQREQAAITTTGLIPTIRITIMTTTIFSTIEWKVKRERPPAPEHLHTCSM